MRVSVSRGRHSTARCRTIRSMTKSILTPGADVITTQGRGTVIDVRATPSGAFVIGVEDADGEVRYFTEKALQLA
jgi:hypothetical protein